MTTHCFYHADDDGFGAAWVVRKALSDQVRFHPVNYGLPVPAFEQNDQIYIVDFSYKRDVMHEICDRAASVVVLDHHKTAEAELKDFNVQRGVECFGRVEIIFEQGKSGVLMAWEYFFGRSNAAMPELIGYLDAGDLWQLDRYPDTKQVQAALRSYPYDFEQWDHWMTPAGLDQLRAEGGAIRRFIDQKVAELLKTQHTIEVDGQKVQAVNAPWFLASEVAGGLAEQEDGPGWGVCYYSNFDGRTFSLRSRGDVDVSAIAQKLGGGGHHGASGFRVPRV